MRNSTNSIVSGCSISIFATSLSGSPQNNVLPPLHPRFSSPRTRGLHLPLSCWILPSMNRGSWQTQKAAHPRLEFDLWFQQSGKLMNFAGVRAGTLAESVTFSEVCFAEKNGVSLSCNFLDRQFMVEWYWKSVPSRSIVSGRPFNTRNLRTSTIENSGAKIYDFLDTPWVEQEKPLSFNTMVCFSYLLRFVDLRYIPLLLRVGQLIHTFLRFNFLTTFGW
jgi:hypothetical protein